MLAALHVLAALGSGDRPLSGLLAEFARYSASGEINSEVDDQQARMTAVETAFAERPGASVDHPHGQRGVPHLDPRTVAQHGAGDLTAVDGDPVGLAHVMNQARMEALRDQVLGIVRG